MPKKKKLAGSIDKKLSNLVEIVEEKNWEIVNKVVDKKVVNEKLPNLVGYWGGKPTLYEWGWNLKDRNSIVGFAKIT